MSDYTEYTIKVYKGYEIRYLYEDYDSYYNNEEVSFVGKTVDEVVKKVADYFVKENVNIKQYCGIYKTLIFYEGQLFRVLNNDFFIPNESYMVGTEKIFKFITDSDHYRKAIERKMLKDEILILHEKIEVLEDDKDYIIEPIWLQKIFKDSRKEEAEKLKLEIERLERILEELE